VPLDFYDYYPEIVEESEKDKEMSKGSNSLVSVLSECKNLCLFYEISIPMYLKGVHLGLLWNIWELMITETPTLVITNSPEEASFMVGIMISLMHPLKFMGDYRPYVTLYDLDMKKYADIYNTQQSTSILIMGSCNSYFTKVIASL